MNSIYAPVRERLTQDRISLLAQVAGIDAEGDVLKASTGEMRRELLAEGDTVSVERQVLARLSASARSTLLEIEEAIARIDAGTYGACTDCRTDIPVERLEFRPHSKQCVPCASRRSR